MYKTFEQFKKSTAKTHSVLVNSGAKIKLSAYREEIAKSLGFSDVNSLKSELENSNIQTYVLVCMFGGIIEEIHTFKYDESGNEAMSKMFKDKVSEDMKLDETDNIDDMDQMIYNEAIENLFYESGKLLINCYVKV